MYPPRLRNVALKNKCMVRKIHDNKIIFILLHAAVHNFCLSSCLSEDDVYHFRWLFRVAPKVLFVSLCVYWLQTNDWIEMKMKAFHWMLTTLYLSNTYFWIIFFVIKEKSKFKWSIATVFVRRRPSSSVVVLRAPYVVHSVFRVTIEHF